MSILRSPMISYPGIKRKINSIESSGDDDLFTQFFPQSFHTLQFNPMLSQLPSEIIYHIAIYLPTASSLANLSQTCKRLNRIVTTEDSRIYRALVQSQFPSIEAPPYWKDAARALTSRSRALDRAAVITRVVVPYETQPPRRNSRTVRTDRPTIGYQPVIDCYERWAGETWAEREEVLAWGAGSELLIQKKHFGRQQQSLEQDDEPSRTQSQQRTSEARNGDIPKPGKTVTFASFNDLQRFNSYDDICAVHLLRPEQRKEHDDGREDVVIGRRNGDLTRMLISHDGKSYDYKQSYLAGGRYLERADISSGPRPVLAATVDRKFIKFFHLEGEEAEPEVQPFASLETAPVGSRLLCDNRFAAGVGVPNEVSIFEIGQDEIIKTRDIGVDEYFDEYDILERKTQPSSMVPLPVTSRTGGNPGDIFLAGWADSKTRLYDLRSRKPHVTTFMDTVDDSPIYSIHPFGWDHFAVGNGQDALVKLFDMRMPGTEAYSYLNARPHLHKNKRTTSNSTKPQNPHPSSKPIPITPNYHGKNISIFLSHKLPASNRRGRNNSIRYRGPVYALSSPSPSSSTLYAGVENNIVRLDFASTDDLTGPSGSWYNDNLGLDLDLGSRGDDNVLSVACYERPPVTDMDRGMHLLRQEPFAREVKGGISSDNGGGRVDGVVKEGWDRRWKHPY